ncbi:hypothetical protein [Xenorhabdus littoralis]|uniref:hypothetical protein n=1 Tax=Xenorhabdus littoralis TaxID=2582835 RepID=UPI0029E7D9A8|nr:hypothetical protein [Xenorhabdus sp. Reich]
MLFLACFWAEMVRYTDDMPFTFEYLSEAKCFYTHLTSRCMMHNSYCIDLKRLLIIVNQHLEVKLVYKVLLNRLNKYGLELHSGKSQLIPAGRITVMRANQLGGCLPTFNFLLLGESAERLLAPENQQPKRQFRNQVKGGL